MRTRQVEVGRVVLVTYGPLYGELAVVVEIIDHQRMLVQGTNVPRQSMSVKRATLTAIVIKVPRGAGTVAINKAIAKQDLAAKWAETAWAKKVAVRDSKAQMNDFDRFKNMIVRKKASLAARKAFGPIKKAFVAK